MKKLLSMFLVLSIIASMAVPVMATEQIAVEETTAVELMIDETTPVEAETEEVTAEPMADQIATSGQCGETMYWDFDSSNSTLTISGTGDMYAVVEQWKDFTTGEYTFEPGWWNLPVVHVVVEEGVENLSDFAFAQSVYGHEDILETVQLPTSLEAIPEYGFIISTAMTTLRIPEGIKSVTGWPFGYPDQSFLLLTDLYLPESLEKMDILTIYFSGYNLRTNTLTLKNIHYAGTKTQWTQIQRDRTAPMGGLMVISDAQYTGFEKTFDAMNVVFAGESDNDNIFDFDDLLFASEQVEKIVAEPVTYYENETPVMPVFTVYYEDGTTGAVPSGVSVVYSQQWPTEPGTYTMTAKVAGKHDVEPFTVTVLPVVVQEIPTEPLTAPVVELGKDFTDTDALVWEAVDYADSYEIYRATSKTGKYTLVGQTSETYWSGETVPVGKTYYYKVIAVYEADAALNSSESNVVSVTGKCARPAVEGSFNLSTGKPVLSWKKVTSAKKYEIYRSTDNKKFSKLTTTTKTTYTDTKAKAGTWYVYYIVAVGSKSAYNSEPSYTVQIQCLLSRPSLTATVDAATGKPSLSWKKVSGASSYAVGRLMPGGSVENGDFELIVHQTGLSYIDKDAQPGGKYTYTVVAINEGDESFSYLSAEKTVAATCARPVLKSNVTDAGKPVITWEPVAGAVEYQVLRSTKSSSSYKQVLVTTETTYTDESVSAGKTYYYKVVAVGADCKSAQSAYAKVTGKCDIPELAVAAGSTGKPVLTWNKISGAKKYEIWRSIDGAAFKKLTTTTKTTYTDSKATEGAECTYKVKALGSKSSYNGLFSQEHGCIVICAAPSVTAKINTVTGKPSLSWKKITGAVSYDIFRAEEDGAFAYVLTVTGTSYEDASAVADVKYSYKIVTNGKDDVYDSLESAVKSVTATCGQADLQHTINDAGKPVITWEAVDYAVAYKVYRSTKSSSSYKLVATVDELSYVDETVSAGKTYYYKVIAVSENGQGAYSSYEKITGKCAQPEVSADINQTSGKPVISWGKVSGAKKYDIYRSTDPYEGFTKLTTTTKTSYTDTKAVVGKVYFYQVRAVGSKSAYNSVFSEPKGCLTLCAQPVVTAKVDSTTGLPTLTWKAITGAVDYAILRSDNGVDFFSYVNQSTTTFVDQGAVPGVIYYYQVVANSDNINACGYESKTVKATATCAKPVLEGGLTPDGKPYGTWEDVAGADGYKVYRSTKSGSGYKAIDISTEGNLFFDLSAKKGTTYYYKITAIADGVESAQSNYIKVKSK